MARFTMSEAEAWQWAANLTRGIRPAGSDAPDLTPDWAPEKDESGSTAEALIQAACTDFIIVDSKPETIRGLLLLDSRFDDGVEVWWSLTTSDSDRPIVHLVSDVFGVESLGDRGQVGAVRVMSILREAVDAGNHLWAGLMGWAVPGSG